jgi:hypothetical protein
MAGECMCDDMNGYTHGALQRGKVRDFLQKQLTHSCD